MSSSRITMPRRQEGEEMVSGPPQASAYLTLLSFHLMLLRSRPSVLLLARP